jgi:hypothetical protein
VASGAFAKKSSTPPTISTPMLGGNNGAIEYTRKLVTAHTVGLMSAPPLLHRSVHRPADTRSKHSVVPADELRALLRDCHPNVLIVGHDAAVETVLSELYPLVRLPITSIRVDHRFDLPSLLASGTLILRNLTALTWADQRRLHDWMKRTGGVMQVVATSATPLLPLLERGTFLDTLYYRLNVLYIRGTGWRECRRKRRTRRPNERAVRCDSSVRDSVFGSARSSLKATDASNRQVRARAG